MGLGELLFGWPLLPLRGVIKLGEVIQEQAERELHDPAIARRELEEIAEARAAGRISAEEEALAIEQVVRRMSGGR
ncbi:gas vesicle protein GvpG [Microtetraspora glauca]|uniref:Gas vesicle protein GvpG n=1 Tax=Microtetraspora glauca TaxID=1996 RepID=A0ABV3GNW2_MICGL